MRALSDVRGGRRDADAPRVPFEVLHGRLREVERPFYNTAVKTHMCVSTTHRRPLSRERRKYDHIFAGLCTYDGHTERRGNATGVPCT